MIFLDIKYQKGDKNRKFRENYEVGEINVRELFK